MLNGLYFECDYNGCLDINLYEYWLMIYGLVCELKIYMMEDLLWFLLVLCIYFVECGVNLVMEWVNFLVFMVQYIYGMFSCVEWIGVLLFMLLEDVGFDVKQVKYILVEGVDGVGFMCIILIFFVLNDVLVVYGQNGEMVCFENGYLFCLIVFGVQGVLNVKWLCWIKVGDQLWNICEELLQYSDVMFDGSICQYIWIQEVKLVIILLFGGQYLLDKGGYYEISGLVWFGCGCIKCVDVFIDGGKNWCIVKLQMLVLDKVFICFWLDWIWDGSFVLLQSCCIDLIGYVQLKMCQLCEVCGISLIYYNNVIQTWFVDVEGKVYNVEV